MVARPKGACNGRPVLVAMARGKDDAEMRVRRKVKVQVGQFERPVHVGRSTRISCDM